MKTYSMMDITPTVCCVMGVREPAASQGAVIQDIADDFQGCDKVALLVLDAFGVFAWELWQDEMPYMQSLHAKASAQLRSVLPSITPVNFSAMVTGTDLEGHKVQTYRHPFGCETLFDVLTSLGKTSTGTGFEGYTAGELLAPQGTFDGTTERGSDDNIVDTIITLAEAHQPDFIIAQYGKVDDEFHRYGPSSPEVVPMLRDTDARIQRTVAALLPLGYGIIIFADHGQHDIVDDPTTTLKGGHGSDSDIDCLVPVTWVRA